MNLQVVWTIFSWSDTDYFQWLYWTEHNTHLQSNQSDWGLFFKWLCSMKYEVGNFRNSHQDFTSLNNYQWFLHWKILGIRKVRDCNNKGINRLIVMFYVFNALHNDFFLFSMLYVSIFTTQLAVKINWLMLLWKQYINTNTDSSNQFKNTYQMTLYIGF